MKCSVIQFEKGNLLKLIYIIGFCFSTQPIINSQSTFYKEFGLHEGVDNITKNIASIDNFLYTCSIKYCPIDSATFKECVIVVKYDQYGNKMQKLVIDSLYATFESPLINIENKLYLCGRSDKDEDKSGAVIYELDKDLNVIDQLNFELSNSATVNVRSINVIKDKKYIYGTFVDLSLDKANAFIGCWNDNCTLDNIQLYPARDLNVFMNDLQATPDGQIAFILMHKPAAGPNGFPSYELIKTDLYGNPLKTFDFYDILIGTQQFTLTIDNSGSFYFNSIYNPVDDTEYSIGRLNKFSSDLDSLEWTLILPNDSLTFGRRYRVYNSTLAKNGDILVCGSVLDDENLALGYDIHSVYTGFICRINSEGEVVWLRLYKFPNNDYLPISEYGQFKESIIIDIKELDDGSILAGGNSKLTGNQKQHENYELLDDKFNLVWLMKVDSSGCLANEDCKEVIHLQNNPHLESIIDTNKQWNVIFNYLEDPSLPSDYKKLFFTNDTVQINNYIYHPLISTDDFNSKEGSILGLFREEGNILYKYIREDDPEYRYYNLPIGEKVYHDFNLAIGDTIKDYYFNTYKIVVTDIDRKELLDGSTRKMIKLECLDGAWRSSSYLVEGIGNLGHSFYGPYLCGANEEVYELLCYYENDTLKFGNEDSECWGVGIHENTKKFLEIFPNPTNHTLYIESLPSKKLTYRIYNLTGKLIQTNNLTDEIDVSVLESGFYILTIYDKTGNLYSRLNFVKASY